MSWGSPIGDEAICVVKATNVMDPWRCRQVAAAAAVEARPTGRMTVAVPSS